MKNPYLLFWIKMTKEELRCKTCQQGKRLWNRDLNAVKNILAISESEIQGLGRPEYLCRTGS
jgi:transposase